MDPKDIRTLHILESVDRERPPSQRDLAKELNISLGLVNAFIKRLVKRGYFKVTHIPRNRIRYILTPEGASEKTRLTYAYIQHSYRLYKKAHQKLRRQISRMETAGVRRIVLYGANDLAEIACLLLAESCIQVAAIIDDTRIGARIGGIRVASSRLLTSIAFDRILITSFEAKPIILDFLENSGITEDLIATL